MAVMFGGMLMRLAPLLEFSLWGSDWGEYYGLADGLVRDGAHQGTSLGWGRAYVDFTGVFDLAGAIVLLTGVGTPEAMTLVLPCVSAISCLLGACIVLRLGGGAWGALVTAGVLALSFPVVFTNSHPVPGALGSVLLFAVMLVYMTGDSWRREEGVDALRPMALYALMVLISFTLVITHHLSLFFLIIIMAFAHLVRSAMVTGREPQRSIWSLWSLTAALALASVYWLLAADTFREEVMVDLTGYPGWAMMALAWACLLALVLAGRALSRRVEGPPRLLFWGPSLLIPSLMVYFVVAMAVVGAVAVFGFPGTDIPLGGTMVAYVLPTVAVFALLVGSTDHVLRRHGGHVMLAWIAALGLSFIAASLVRSGVLIPYRHVPYLVDACAVLMGVGAVHLHRMLSRPGRAHGERRTGRAALVTAAAAMAVLLALTAYPPKEVMGNFQEGTTESELGASLWVRGGLPRPGATREDPSSGVVATDHRMSSMVFGIGGAMASWDTAGPVLHGEPGPLLWEAMDDLDTPNGDRRVTAVVLSEDLRSGAALSQVEAPEPVEGDAWEKFHDPPFVKVYDGGNVWVLYVVRPVDTAG